MTAKSQATHKRRGMVRRTMRWSLALLAVVGLGWAVVVGRAGAQTPDMPAKSYLNKQTFYFPVTIDERTRATLQEVRLFVKRSPSQPWELRDRIAPQKTSFAFRGDADGDYYFAVVMVDKSGRMTPADVSKEPPAVSVVLDTQPPGLDVYVLASTPEGIIVRCDVHDANPNPAKTQFQFQTGNGSWHLLEPLPQQLSIYCIPKQAMLTGMIRVTVIDLAGNMNVREGNLSALPSGPGLARAGANSPGATSPGATFQGTAAASGTAAGVTPAMPPGAAQTARHVPTVIEGKEPPMLADQITRTPVVVGGEKVEVIVNKGAGVGSIQQTDLRSEPIANAPLRSLPLPQSPVAATEAAAVKPPPHAHPPQAHPAQAHRPADAAWLNKKLVHQPRMMLEYQIDHLGASGVGKVEVWLTRDMGQTWQKLCEDADRKSPVLIDLPGEGVFGVRLVVANGRGFGATPPQPGEAPDMWVEVDTTRPFAELGNIRPAGDDSGSLYITWTARDKNLSTTPVDLFYAADRNGPWQPIAKGLRNDEYHRWVPPANLGPQAFIRMVVQDLSGNMTQCDTAQPVALDDLSRPRGRVIGVTVAPPTLSLEGNAPKN